MDHLSLYMLLFGPWLIFQSSLSSKEKRQLQEDLGKAEAQLAGGRGASSVSHNLMFGRLGPVV